MSPTRRVAGIRTNVRQGHGPFHVLHVVVTATGVAAVVVVGALLALPGRLPLAGAAPAGPQEGQTVMIFPNLQTAGNWEGDTTESVAGMDGMGESVIEVQNMSGQNTKLDFDFFSNVVSSVLESRTMAPLSSARYSLDSMPGTEFSNYSGRVTSDGPVGGVVRTTWYGGASVVHEALTSSRDLILPLVVREVYSNSSIIYLKNLDPPGVVNTLDFELMESDGSIRKSWTVTLKGEEALPDDLYRERIFYLDLPQNAADGFIGSFHVTSKDPIAVALYGDEPFGVGSFALVGKPSSEAADRQYLPLVRANYLGDTLINITNVESTAIDVTITYMGHPASPSGASQTIRQTIHIPARYYANVDLSDLGRGSVASPDIPRGEGFNTGFLGSAYLRGTGKFLAAAWEEYRESNYVLGSAAYNAFGPQDLGTSFVVPRAFMAADGQPSFLIAMNPGTEPADITTTLYNDDGSIYGDLYPVTVPEGQMQFIAIATPDYDNVRVVAHSTQPIALLVLDARPSRDRTEYAAVKMPANVVFPTATPTAVATAGPSPTASGTGGPQTATPTPTVRPTGDHWAFLPAAFRKH